VCGWLNGKANQIQKYSNMYLSFGSSYRVVTFESTSIDFFKALLPLKSSGSILFGKHPYTIEFEKLKEFFSQQQLIVHVMSNGGLTTWALLSDYIKASNIELKISSIVYDSCPSVYNPTRVTNLSVFYTHLPFGFKKILMTSFFVPLAWLMTFYFRKYPERHLFSLIRRKLFSEQIATIPKLFLYSQNDKTVRYTDIQSIIALSRQISISVNSNSSNISNNNNHQLSSSSSSSETVAPTAAIIEEVDFVDSNHVAHLMAYPEKYKSTIKAFIELHVVK